ncbi:hypothetical protein D3C87_1695680 [compost metagenome]
MLAHLGCDRINQYLVFLFADLVAEFMEKDLKGLKQAKVRFGIINDVKIKPEIARHLGSSCGFVGIQDKIFVLIRKEQFEINTR